MFVSQGKTYQALAVADFYKDDWPLLILSTATARGTWETHVKELLPWVPNDSIKCITSANDYIGDPMVLITTYSLMERLENTLSEKKFGFVILVRIIYK